ncbi:MAG: protein kinase [Spirochaetes bacterium]|nr:protein kinase [Spirochaetota bacterium]
MLQPVTVISEHYLQLALSPPPVMRRNMAAAEGERRHNVMKRLFDYLIQNKIAETHKSVVFRAVKEGAGEPVIIKLLKHDRPTATQLARLRQEFERIRQLDLEGIARTHEIIEHASGFALVFEDFGGIPLSQYREGGTLELGEFLDIAIRIARILGEIHKKKVIHRDIKPSNILIHEATGEVRITDFGISLDSLHEIKETGEGTRATGTFAYMSPEQTGRLNRVTDSRSDLYSLGITFYELLTGIVPFTSKDPMEVIHSHIARRPVAPRKLNLSIPSVVSDMIMKLLEKNPEDRYQSCSGLMADLLRCRMQLQETGRIDTFPIGSFDQPETLSLPSSLFGRESLIASFMARWENVRKGRKSLLLVQGPRGSGKSAVLQEMKRCISTERCFVLMGGTGSGMGGPYGHLVDSVRDMVHEILKEPAERLDLWNTRISLALGAQGRVITEIIPDLEKIIGHQREVANLGTEESLNRIIFLFKKFFSVFCTQEHPLILILDDLQDADLPTFSLIQSMLLDQSFGYFMVAASFREDLVDRSHRLMIMEEIVRGSDTAVIRERCEPLTADHIREILSRGMHRSDNETARLSEVVHRKTGGNPFFVHQFIQSLYADGILHLQPEQGWQWNLEAVKRLQMTENVADLLAVKFKNLPESTRDTLSHGACIGPRFDIDMLSRLTGKPIAAILADLEPALRDEIIEFQGAQYEFRHQRLHELVYSLVGDERKAETHLAIGKTLKALMNEAETDDLLYFTVNHMNRGAWRIENGDDRVLLANLNKRAALKSHNSAAYDTALSYVRTGLSLLPADAWEGHYDLYRQLSLLGAQCEYVTSSFAEAERYFDEVIRHSRSPEERARIHSDKSALFIGIGNHSKSVEEALSGLECLDIHLPRRPRMPRIFIELAAARTLRHLRSIESLGSMKTMRSGRHMLVMELLMHITISSYFVDVNMMLLAVIKMTEFSLLHGNSSYSAFAYCWYGMLLGVLLNDRERGYRFGLLALQLNERYYNPQLHYVTSSAFGLFINHWRRHVSTCMEYFDRAYTQARESGDVSFAGYLTSWTVCTSFVRGEILGEMLDRCNGYLSFFEQFKSGNEYIIYPVVGYIHNLLGTAPGPGDFSHGVFREELFGKITNVTSLYIFHLAKCHFYLLFGNYQSAWKHVAIMRKNLRGAVGLIAQTHCYFYSALIAAVLSEKARGGQKRKFLRIFKRQLRRIRTIAGQSPINCTHMMLLAEAESARLRGRYMRAQAYYDRAIESAHDGGFLHDEGLACETAARFYIAGGRRNVGKAYLTQARNAFLRWGAMAKVRDLDELYPQLSVTGLEQRLPADTGLRAKYGKNATGSLVNFDIATVLRLSTEISSEIRLDRLMVSIMRIILLNAGAQRGVLILNRGGELMVEVEGSIESQAYTFHESTPLREYEMVPESVIQYVERTRESVILDNPRESGLFSADSYIQSHRIKSALSFPLIRQDEIEGIMYLENNLTSRAFSEDRLQVLHILGTQAAVSLQNATLFDRAHQVEQVLTRQFEETQSQYEELEAMNDVLTKTHNELQDANSEMEKMRNYLQNILDSMPSVIIGIGPDLKVNHWNREAVRMTDISSADSYGRPVQDVFPFFRDRADIITRAIADKEVQKAEKVQHLTGDDSLYHDVIVYPLSGIFGEGAVIRIDDVTTRVNIESFIVQSEKMMSIGGLAAGMAHEINNPLSGILMSAQNIVRRVSPDLKANADVAGELGIDLHAVRRYLERRGLLEMIDGIMEMGGRASKIVEHMLAYSRKSDSRKTPMDLGELVNRTVDLASKEYDLSKKYDFRHISIVRDFSDDVPHVPCVTTEIEQVLLNLFKNAAQAMLADEGRTAGPSITIRLSRAGETVQLEVEDNGPGMTQEQCRRAFEPFYTTKKTGKGTGLGLSVSYFIVTENHGGTMRVVSSPGAGANFIINLPL